MIQIKKTEMFEPHWKAEASNHMTVLFAYPIRENVVRTVSKCSRPN